MDEDERRYVVVTEVELLVYAYDEATARDNAHQILTGIGAGYGYMQVFNGEEE